MPVATGRPALAKKQNRGSLLSIPTTPYLPTRSFDHRPRPIRYSNIYEATQNTCLFRRTTTHNSCCPSTTSCRNPYREKNTYFQSRPRRVCFLVAARCAYRKLRSITATFWTPHGARIVYKQFGNLNDPISTYRYVKHLTTTQTNTPQTPRFPDDDRS